MCSDASFVGSLITSEALRGVCFEATAPLISRTDDTLRKPVSRLLYVTVTVIQASMQTHTHTDPFGEQ